MLMTVGHECGEDADGVFLLCCRRKTEGTTDAICQFVSNHLCCKDTIFF
jgi:hypothetical protein